MSPVVIKTGPQSQPVRASRNFTDSEDFFSVGQAFQDWFRLLVSPRVFCEEQEGAAGMLSPLALLLAYSLAFGAFYLIILFGYGARLGMAGIFAMFLVVIVVPVTWLAYLVFCLIIGGVLHVASRLFRGEGEYSGSFRVAVYSLAPIAMLLILAGAFTLAFLPPWNHTPGEENIFRLLANLIGCVWGVVLAGMSLRATQRLTTGGAIGATVAGCGMLAGLFILVGEAIRSL